MKQLKRKTVKEKIVKGILERVAQVEAGSASCMMLYQPKAPDQLYKFKKDAVTARQK